MRFLVVFFSVLMASSAFSQQPQQTPNVQIQHQLERPLQNQQGSGLQDQSPRPTAATPAHHEEDGTEFWPAFLGYRLKITDTLIAGFTALLFWATWLLWRATKRLVRGADTTAQRQLRAYVSGFPNFVYAFSEGGHIQFKYALKNVGTTPALKLQNHAEAILVPRPLPDGFALPPLTTTLTAQTVLFPNLPMNGTQTSTEAISRADIAKLVAGDLQIMVYGRIFYEDIFGTEQRTDFCAIVGADKPTMKHLTSSYKPDDLKLTFTIAPVGNSAT